MKQWIKLLFYKPKYARVADKSIYRLLLPSVIGMMLCMVFLAGMTWAWFTANVSASTQAIVTAHYDVAVLINDEEISTKNGQYTLTSGANTVKLTAVGNASTGYCKIILNGNAESLYYTPQFPNPKGPSPVTAFTFTIKVSTDTQMTVIPVWGTYAASDKSILDSLLDLTAPQSDEPEPLENSIMLSVKSINSNESASQSYTVISGDSLWKIAQQYGVTCAQLAAFNNLDASEPLQVGQILEIPPADYIPPEKSADPVSETDGIDTPLLISDENQLSTLTADITSESNESIENTEQSYTVISGDRIWTIAQQFGITGAQLSAYNGIEEAASLQVGQILKIPPADYIPPEKSAVLSAESEEKQDTSVSVGEENNASTEPSDMSPAPNTNPAQDLADEIDLGTQSCTECIE